MKTAARARVTELQPLGEALDIAMASSAIAKGVARKGRETAETAADRDHAGGAAPDPAGEGKECPVGALEALLVRIVAGDIGASNELLAGFE